MDVLVIADDLTGANATGVKLNQLGLKAATIVNNRDIPDEPYDALSFDTDSRYDEPTVAQNKIYQVFDQINTTGLTPIIYSKRIDTTLRGNLGAEIDAMLNQLGDDTVAIVVPSYPKSKRISVGGYLLVDGTPLQETGVAKDPVKPIETSKVTQIISSQSNSRIASVGLNEVLSGIESIKKTINEHIESGSKIICIDAVTDDEIENIAKAASQLEKNILAVDPGPFTAAYTNEVINHKAIDYRYIVTIGSVTSLTRRQIQYFIDKNQVEPVYVKPENLATFTGAWEKEVQQSIKKAKQRFEHDQLLLVTTNGPEQSVLDLEKISLNEGVSKEKLAKRITDGLAEITYQLIQHRKDQVGGCYLSGGDLTASICHVAEAEGIQLEGEVLPLASYGRFIGGELNKLPVITKGGLIGDQKAIVECIKYLQTKREKG